MTKILPFEVISSGIKDFDYLLGGGFKKSSTYVIAGTSGTGKTILCTKFLLEGCEQNEKTLYLSFDETVDKLRDNLEAMEFPIKEMESKKLLLLEYTEPNQVTEYFKEGGGIISTLLEKNKPQRIVIDSITTYLLLAQDERDRRKLVIELMKELNKTGATVLIISEHPIDPEKSYNALTEEYLGEGTILLMDKMTGKGNTERLIQVHKMRGLRIDREQYRYEIVPKIGIKIITK